MIQQASDSFQDFENICQQKKESQTSIIDKKASVKDHLQSVFKIIGKEAKFEQLGLWSRKAVKYE